MKKLKKLTRKGLDELAKEMPEMKSVEQSECVGAYRYYYDTSDGSFVNSFSDGGSEEIRIVSYSTWIDLNEIPNYNVDPSEILPYSSDNILYKIVNKQVLDNIVQVNKPGIQSGGFFLLQPLGF